MTLTRRDATKLLAVGASLAAAPLPAVSATNEQWALRLADDLNGTLKPGCGGRFSVTEFGQLKRQDGQFHFASVVRLDWPPGYRTRRYDAVSGTEDDTFLQLLFDAYVEFRDAWPGCVV